MLRLRHVLLLALLAAPGGYCAARTVAAPDPHHIDGTGVGSTIDLTQTWLLHPGDDARYADPHFDDSQWTVVTADVPLATYGYKNFEFVWYRTHVRVRSDSHDLALLLREFSGSN